jgi:hypothetical protein
VASPLRPGWAAALVLVAVLLDVGAPDGAPAAVSIAKQLPVFAAFAYVGVRVLRMSDAEWERPSEPTQLVTQPQPA